MSKRLHVTIQAGEISEQIVEVAESATYEDLLDKLNINQETVLVLNEGNAVPLDGAVNSDRLTILKVVTGG
ncbi:Ubiquitin-like small archaeal modifier protein SAMP2 [Methanosarcina siciliae T4/M]|uniref:Ubiquitin-like small archaeal modifier protein SAMP2 n=2 Tax=Methanosarcina siciliae TaxID=38027 RepID=A0A0E3LAF0_9EURY|nr:MoaD/ThiS family protein [Methanosarcina siciliae]AKB27992.1 Ubiquitin-like small archaeal modifier protein SAMP2 [Methanosarcina siciliae T4/M]AKB31906.1 Ubiquitin-like small archaeal modifier protein SAMP2 [Methanosarcina siciliae HI350]